MALVQFCADDSDLDDAELWAVIDSAAASHSAHKAQPRKPSIFSPQKRMNSKFDSPVVTEIPPSPGLPPFLPDLKRVPKAQKRFFDHIPAHAHQSRHPYAAPQLEYHVEEDAGVSSNGEVVQQPVMHHPQKLCRYDTQRPENNNGRRPQNSHSYASHVKPLQQIVSPPSASSKRYAIQAVPSNVTDIVERPHSGWHDTKENSGSNSNIWNTGIPSASMFKQYQNTAMSILEKGDYILMQGKPFIKKSGWRKIAFFFNISFEIKDKTIQFDQNSNVLRAEFVIRASMQGGRFSDGWASCDRGEKRFSKPNHDIPSTAETRAKTRACQDLLGIGEYKPGGGDIG